VAFDTRKPSFLDRAIAAVAPTYALERAVARQKLTFFGYDAANPGTVRGSSGGMAKNAGSETPAMAQDRLKLMWEARDLERNMPIIRCVLDRMAQYVCGQIRYQAQTGNPEVDALTESYWQEWCESAADLTHRHNFRMLVELAFRSMLRDGDFGFVGVRNGSLYQLQCIESDRIGDPNKVSMQNLPDQVQGIRIDPNGTPVGYDVYIRDRHVSRYQFDRTVPANDFFFLSRPLRTDEYRTVSWLAPIIAPARDLYEFFAFERGAAKWAASIAGVITVSNPLDQGPGGNAGMWDGRTVEGVPTETVQGNKLLRLKPNESVTPFNTGARPSGAFAAYIDAALRDIAMGLNVPYGFFDMSRFGGATVRLEAMQLDRTFKRYQEILVSKILEPIKRTVLNNAIAMQEIPATQGWNFGRWQFGPHLTADTGYDTDANLQLLAHGLKPAAEIAGEGGYDFDEITEQIVKETTLLRDACQAAGLPIELVAPARFPDATNQLAAVAAAAEPQPTPTITDIGDGAAKQISELLTSAAKGELPREQVINLLVTVYQFDPAAAALIVPTPQPLAIAANMPAPPAEGKPKGEGEEPEKKSSEPKEFRSIVFERDEENRVIGAHFATATTPPCPSPSTPETKP